MADLNKIDTGLFEKVKDVLDEPEKMSTRTGMQLIVEMTFAMIKNQNELIEHVKTQNGRVKKNEDKIATLQDNSLLMIIKKNPTKSFLVMLGVFALNSMVNWAGLRRPLLAAFFRLFGLDVPEELIP